MPENATIMAKVHINNFVQGSPSNAHEIQSWPIKITLKCCGPTENGSLTFSKYIWFNLHFSLILESHIGDNLNIRHNKTGRSRY